MNRQENEDSELQDSRTSVLVKSFIHPIWSNNLSEFKVKCPAISELHLHFTYTPDSTITLRGCLKNENKEIAGAAPRIPLSVTPCLVLPLKLRLSRGRSEGQECDPPQISQGSNELHVALRLGARRSSWALLARLPPAALQAYRVTPISGQRSPPGST